MPVTLANYSPHALPTWTGPAVNLALRPEASLSQRDRAASHVSHHPVDMSTALETLRSTRDEIMSMSRPQIGIDRLPARRMSNEPKEAMNCKSCRKRKVAQGPSLSRPALRAPDQMQPPTPNLRSMPGLCVSLCIRCGILWFPSCPQELTY